MLLSPQITITLRRARRSHQQQHVHVPHAWQKGILRAVSANTVQPTGPLLERNY